MGRKEKKEKKKKSLFKKLLIIVVVLLALMFVFAMFSDDEDSSQYADTNSTSSESAISNAAGSFAQADSVTGAEYVVQDPVGEYRKFSSSKAADSYSEEIKDLTNGKHFINQAFDFTEYATTINDKHSGNWGIYVYMCGSNLESEGAAATDDINEMLNASLPADSNIVIQAGGATQWNMEGIDPNYLQRLVYDGNSFGVVDSQKQANMGAQKTLEDFLTFCRTNYPADNEMVIFWNHGGASIGGACYDELYDDDHLTLNEIDGAFTNVYGKERIEVVGFDCCLMATVDTAELLRNHAKMLVASEELEPGNGWYYSDWLIDLAIDPTISNAKLGKSICDSFIKGCEMYGTDSEATLSAIDLTQINLVTGAVNAMGAELLSSATDNPDIIADFGRAARASENYGGNNDSSGYFDMVDLGDLLDHSKSVFPTSIDYARYALNRAVVYNVHGYYRSESTGLSVFYPYDKTEANQQRFEAVTASDIYASAVRYAFTGKLSQESVDLIEMYREKVASIYSDDATATADESAQDSEDEDYDAVYDNYYENDNSYTTMSRGIASKSVSADKLNSNGKLEFTNNGEDLILTIDDEGYLTTSVGKGIDAVESVICELLQYDEAADRYISYGWDNDVQIDWETGEIKDNFRGVWACIDGHKLFLDIVYQGDDYNLYTVPVRVNGKEMDMTISYDYNKEEYGIIGLSDSIAEGGQYASKQSVMPKTGDKIVLIGEYYDFDEEDWFTTEYDEFVYDEKMKIGEEDLGDGLYAIMFITIDMAGNEVYSEYGYIEYENGDIYPYTDADMED